MIKHKPLWPCRQGIDCHGSELSVKHCHQWHTSTVIYYLLLTASLTPERPALGLRPDVAPVRRNLRAPSRRLHQRNRRAPARRAHVTTRLCPCSQTVTYATPSSQHPSRFGDSIHPYGAPSLAPNAPSSLVSCPSPIPRSYGCIDGSGRNDAAEGGRRIDATPYLLLKHPNTTVATYI
jgi:hypothetical protein